MFNLLTATNKTTDGSTHFSPISKTFNSLFDKSSVFRHTSYTIQQQNTHMSKLLTPLVVEEERASIL